VLVKACAAVKPAGDLFGLLEAVHNFVTASTIRHDKFVSVQRERGEIVMELPLQFESRWVCKLKAVTTFKERFFSVILTLQFFCESKKPRERVDAKGLLCQLMELSFVFMLHLSDKILSLTNSLSTYCQSKTATMTTAFTLVSSTRSVLQDMQSSDSFDKLYCAAISSCAEFGIKVDFNLALKLMSVRLVLQMMRSVLPFPRATKKGNAPSAVHKI